jgi:MFS family permease
MQLNKFNIFSKKKSFLDFLSTTGTIPILCIMGKEAYQLFFFLNLKSDKENAIAKMIIVWIVLQIIFSIVFGMISDKYCRRKTLNVTLGCSLLSILLLKGNFLWSAIIVDGIFCNIIPIARAAYCDIHTCSGRTPNLVNTFMAQAVPWIVLSFNYAVFHNHLFLIVVSFAVIIFLLSTTFFQDFRDKESKIDGNQLKKIYEKFFKAAYIKIALALLIWNSAWWLLLYYGEVMLDEESLQKYFFLIVGIAFFVGTLIAKIFRFSPKKTIPLIFLFTFLLFFFDWVLAMALNLSSIVTPSLFLQFTIIGGIGLPLIYAFFGERATIHEQGTIYGILESVLSASGFLGPFLLSCFVIKDLGHSLFLPLLTFSALLVVSMITRRKNRKKEV